MADLIGGFDGNLLYDLACECEELFDSTIPGPPEDSSVWSECQQRFAIWASHIGVFARESQSLDTRLRKAPDVQDLVARILDILRRSLTQYIHAQESTRKENEAHPEALRESALMTIEDALTRLNRLGVDIRQASRGRMDTKVQEFASRFDLLPFLAVSEEVVGCLYSGTHESLKSHLCKGMVDIYTRIRFLEHRQGKLQTRRSPGTVPVMQTINEDEMDEGPDSGVADDNRAQQLSRPLNSARSLALQNPDSQSDLSTVNTKQLRGFLSPSMGGAKSVRQQKTSTVQVQQANYPRPHIAKDDNIFKCDWCAELFNKTLISEGDWRRHVDKDLKPYRCMMENCSDAHPAFTNFDDWFRHMYAHNRRWHQRVFLTQGWGCAVCDWDEVYTSPEALLPHLQEAHSGQFTAAQLETISRQGVSQRPRSCNECPLCAFTVDQAPDQSTPMPPKRQKEPLQKENAKMARMTLEMRSPNPHRKAAKDSSDSDSDSSSNSEAGIPAAVDSGNARVMARHIAAHLQALMLLTIRLAILSDGENTPFNEGDNESIDIDESKSSAGTRDIGKLSDIASIPDMEMVDNDDLPLGDDNIAPEGQYPVPPDDMEVDDDIAPHPFYPDPVQAEANRFYRERREAIRVAELELSQQNQEKAGMKSDQDAGTPQIALDGESVVDRWNDKGAEETVKKYNASPALEDIIKKERYEFPNADVFIDMFLRAEDERNLLPRPMDPPSSWDWFRTPNLDSRHRPTIIITVPTPPPSPPPVSLPPPENMDLDRETRRLKEAYEQQI